MIKMMSEQILYKLYIKKLSQIKKNNINNNYEKRTIVYVSGKKILVFIAGLHLGGEKTHNRKLFINFIKLVSKKIRPRVVLLELPRNLPKQVMNEWLRKPKKYWLESEWLIYYGKNYGNAKYVCMDITSKEWTNATINFDGINNFKLVLFSNFLMKFIWAINYWYINNKKIASKEDIYQFAKCNIIKALMDNTDSLSYIKKDVIKLHIKNKNKNFNTTIENILKEMANKYVKKGVKLDSLINMEKPSAYLFPFNKYKINKVLVHEDAIRDRNMMKTIFSTFIKHDRVIAMAGSSHINRLGDLFYIELKRKFKDTKMMTWDEFIKTDINKN